MPPEPSDDERTSETPVVESPVSAGSAPDELPDLIDALRADHAEKTQAASTGDEQDDDDEEESDDSEEESSQEEAAPESAPTAEQRRPNRLQRTRAELERTKAEAAQHRQSLEELRASIVKTNQEAWAKLGNDDEFKALAAKASDPRQTLSYAEESRYLELYEARERMQQTYGLASATHRLNQQQARVQKAVQYDIPPDELLQASDDGELIDRVIQRTKAQVHEEYKDTIARLEADNQSLLTKLAGRSKDPGVGGRSAAGRADMPSWDEAEPMDYFKVKRQPAGANHR